ARSATATDASAGSRSPAFRSERAASPSPTRTLPARMSAWALVLGSARARSTRSWSRRCRDALPRAFRVAVALTPVSWHSPLHRGSPRREEPPVNQPVTLAAAAILNVIIGLSGLAVGLTLVAALPAMAAASDVAFGDGIVIVIPLYGLAATLGGIGTWRRSWVGWTLVAAVDGLGLGVL